MRDYIIPVVFRKVNEFSVKANNQAEAILKVNKIIKNSVQANYVYDNFKILGSEVTCLQDEEILKEIKKDFNVDNDITIVNNKYKNDNLDCDILCFIDKIAIKDINSFNVDTNNKTISIFINTDCSLKDYYALFTGMNNSELIQVFMFENEEKVYRSFSGLKYSYTSVIDNTNDNLIEKHFFTYENSNPFSIFDCTVEELINHA